MSIYTILSNTKAYHFHPKYVNISLIQLYLHCQLIKDERGAFINDQWVALEYFSQEGT